MRALLQQLDFELQRFDVQHHAIETVFIGGGTPSTVAPELYAPLFERLAPFVHPDAEITSEANPNSATPSWLEGMRALGVNRISFGVQSFNEAKLKILNRAHSAEDALRTVETAHRIGFEHLSLDLIYGVAGDSEALLSHDLETALGLPIDHLSAYALTIEAQTPFEQRPEMADEPLELTRRFFDTIIASGMTQYEISNFGRYRSAHNLGYWQYKDYIGLGSGAVGFLKDTRFYPATDIASYIAAPLQIQEEHLDAGAIKMEKLFLGLRSVVGVDAALLSPQELKRARLLCDEGKLTCKAERFYNPDYLLSDELALFITA